jgi:hypothetical protein
MHFKVFLKFILAVLFLASFVKKGETQDWTHYVRTAGHGLQIKHIHSIIRDAAQTHLSGIEIDNDITGRYKSFLNPKLKLQAIKAMADSAHAHHDHAFVYISGLECITGNADSLSHSLFADHPDWVQRNIEGEPAIFAYGNAFWIHKGDQDAWISPYAPQWRKVYMKRVRQIAATGIDGIYIDIPYWMTHFTGWEDTWASFDKYTVGEFRRQTGINALKDFKPGDWNDPDFIAWVDFRIKSITGFISEINKNIKSVNPACKTILEIFPGIGEAVPRVGADNYSLSQVADVITHEYNPGKNSAERDPLTWMQYMIAMFTFRSFAEGKPTWMLSYSWDGEKGIKPADAMKNLFMSQVTAGANSWDAARFVMSGSNDYAVRSQVYKWIGANERLIYAPRKPMAPVGVYFSPKTRDYFSREWRQSYLGIMEVLLKNHIEFQIVTPRTLGAAQCDLLILPGVKCLDKNEWLQLGSRLKNGRILIFTGETGHYNHKREQAQDRSPMGTLSMKYPHAIRFKDRPGASFYRFMERNYDSSLYNDKILTYHDANFEGFLDSIRKYYSPRVTIKNARGCVSQIASVGNKPTVFIANFSGLRGGVNGEPFPRRNVTITFNNLPADEDTIEFIPFLGKPVYIKGQWSGHNLTVSLPVIFRGAVATVR